MTSKIIVNQIEADAGISSVTFNDTIYGNLEGNTTGNTTGNVTGNVTGNINSSGISTFNVITGVSTIGVTTIHVTGINDLSFPTAGPLSNRNLVINGAMQVAQRGTTGISQNGNNNFVVDRFKVNIAGSSTVTHSQESAGAPAGFSRWLKLTPTVAEASLASSSYGTLSNIIEGYDFAHVNYGTADAQNVTVSFKFKTNKAGTYCMIHRNISADRNYIHEFTPVADGSWQTITYTVPGDTTGTWSTTNSIGWRFELCIGNGTDYQSSTTGSWFSGQYFHSTPNQVNFLDSTSNELGITGVQVELGTKSTPFEHRSFHEEQLKCMRYYQRFGETLPSVAGTDDGFMTFANYTATAAYGGQKFTVPMRGRPTMVAAGCAYYSNGSTDGSINVDMVGASTNYGEIRVTAINMSNGLAGWLRIEGGGAYIEFNAEL